MRKRFFRTKLVQWRQAWLIHGGPLRLAVATLGVRLSRVRIPSRRLRTMVFRRVYGKKYAALDEAEFEQPLAAYRSLNSLFTRGLRPECRPIAAGPDQLVCPCDGTVQEIGRFESDRFVTVKGIEYKLGALLPGVDAARYCDGRYAILFLSPSDCHRIFSPHDVVVEEALHIPGYRLLVHPPFQRPDYPVFALNERVILRLATPVGSCILVLVAGWGVGNITLRFDPAFRPRPTALTRTTYAVPPRVAKGDWLATFELGSTAILITEPTGPIYPHVHADQKVKYGQPLFSSTREG
jgi:phosphatidylserine decarboxylase